MFWLHEATILIAIQPSNQNELQFITERLTEY